MPEGGIPELRALLAGDVVEAAAGLVGCVLARRLPEGRIARGVIIETEAYHQCEPGCHAYRGKTTRNAVMFGPPGHLYVYFTYGMWHCCNVVCEPLGTAAAVLLRAAYPLPPFDGSRADLGRLRLSGPGLLCQGLSITRAQNGANLNNRRGEVWLYRPSRWRPVRLKRTTRIGLSIQDTLKWRFCWAELPTLGSARAGVPSRPERKG